MASQSIHDLPTTYSYEEPLLRTNSYDPERAIPYSLPQDMHQGFHNMGQGQTDTDNLAAKQPPLYSALTQPFFSDPSYTPGPSQPFFSDPSYTQGPSQPISDPSYAPDPSYIQVTRQPSFRSLLANRTFQPTDTPAWECDTTRPPDPFGSRPPKTAVSVDSSLAIQSTPSAEAHHSSNRAYRLTKSGSQREYVSRSRRSGQGSSSTADDNPFRKDIIGRAQALVEISLSTKKSWPAGQEKKNMAFDALSQANVYARDRGWGELETSRENVQTVSHPLQFVQYCLIVFLGV